MNEQSKYYPQAGVAMTCRSFAEYEKMFVLEKADLDQAVILDIAAGASSFTASARSSGIKAFAADPLYLKTIPEMNEFGLQEIEISTAKLQDLIKVYDWTYYGSPELHRENRLRSLEIFMADYAKANANEIYVDSALPHLPFESDSFTLVLCSHFLFLYQEQFDYTFHINAVVEMLRVCQAGGQIRIYPVLDFRGQPFLNLVGLINQMSEHGASAELVPSELPFLPGSTHFLRIKKK